MKFMIQSQNDPLDRLEAKMDRMQSSKKSMNEQIFRISNILELTSQIDMNRESWSLEAFY